MGDERGVGRDSFTVPGALWPGCSGSSGPMFGLLASHRAAPRIVAANGPPAAPLKASNNVTAPRWPMSAVAPSVWTMGSGRRAAAIASPSCVCAFSRTRDASSSAWKVLRSTILGAPSSPFVRTSIVFSFARLLLIFSGRGCGRSFPNDLQHRLRILCSIVVNLFAEMRDEAPGREGNCLVRIEFCSGAYPPRPGDHGDEPVVRVPVRMAHAMRSPFDEHYVQAGLRRIAQQDGGLGTDGVVLPRNLVRQFESEHLGIQILGAGSERLRRSLRDHQAREHGN